MYCQAPGHGSMSFASSSFPSRSTHARRMSADGAAASPLAGRGAQGLREGDLERGPSAAGGGGGGGGQKRHRRRMPPFKRITGTNFLVDAFRYSNTGMHFLT